MLLYHHCMDLENVVYGEIKANPKYSDPDFKRAYGWLEKEVGFYPMFLAVGTKRYDILITGYDTQWKKITLSSYRDGKVINTLRKKGEFPNWVLFSFDNMEGIFTDYEYWHCVLGGDNTANKNERKWILKPSWGKARWLRKARKDPGSVQLVTDKLDLRNAKRVWVRNENTKNNLEDMGFSKVNVRRIPVFRY